MKDQEKEIVNMKTRKETMQIFCEMFLNGEQDKVDIEKMINEIPEEYYPEIIEIIQNEIMRESEMISDQINKNNISHGFKK